MDGVAVDGTLAHNPGYQGVTLPAKMSGLGRSTDDRVNRTKLTRETVAQATRTVDIMIRLVIDA
jgi:hypothetical protein